jgi:hypothetical protein
MFLPLYSHIHLIINQWWCKFKLWWSCVAFNHKTCKIIWISTCFWSIIDLLRKQHVNTFETKVILQSILYKNFQKFCFKMPKAIFTIDCSCLCFLLYKSSNMEFCCPSLWNVMIQGDKGYPLSLIRCEGKHFKTFFTKLKNPYVELVYITQIFIELESRWHSK